MYRVLVVEDIPDTQEGLVSLLNDVYDDWNTDAAGSVDEAKALMDGAVQQDAPYDVVILDFYLPKEMGHMPEGSLQLTEYALKQLPAALIIQMTAFEDDKDLKENLLGPRLQDPDRRVVFIPKRQGF